MATNRSFAFSTGVAPQKMKHAYRSHVRVEHAIPESSQNSPELHTVTDDEFTPFPPPPPKVQTSKSSSNIFKKKENKPGKICNLHDFQHKSIKFF